MRRAALILLLGSCCLIADAAADPAGADVVREFLEGKRRLPAGDGSSFLVGKSPGSCAALPVTKPAGFHISYSFRDGARPDVVPVQFAIGDKDCEVIWPQLHIGTPEVRCSLLATKEHSRLYRELRSLAPHTIKTRAIAASPHRGGYTVKLHWRGHACEVSDSAGVEVVSGDVARFEKLVALTKAACQTAGTSDC